MLLSYWSADGDTLQISARTKLQFLSGPTGSNLSPRYTMLPHVASDDAPTNVLSRCAQARSLRPVNVTEFRRVTRG
jgi:hypothetical protein